MRSRLLAKSRLLKMAVLRLSCMADLALKLEEKEATKPG